MFIKMMVKRGVQKSRGERYDLKGEEALVCATLGGGEENTVPRSESEVV